MNAIGGVIIFVREGLSFSTFFLSLLDPYSDYVGVNISLNNSSLLSFHNVYAPPIHSSTDGRTDSFFCFILPSKNLFILEHFNCHHPSGTQKVLSTAVGRKYLVGSCPLTSCSPSMILKYLLFFIAPVAVASPLTSSLLHPLLPYLARVRCFRNWVLITYQLF